MSSKTIMIPSKIRREGAKGRFDPSEPLHMTTRHAARSVRVNSDPSINGSYDDEESHQTSFDEVRPTTSRSLGSPTSAKDRRVSGTSTNSASQLLPPFELRSSELKRRRSSGRGSSPGLQQSPVRKRKRFSPTPQLDTPNGSETMATPSASRVEYSFDGQFIEVIPPEDLSERGMGSSSPSRSDEQMADDYLGVAESTEFTPAVSEAVSPVSEDSDTEIAFPVKDVIKETYLKVGIKETDVDDGDGDELAEIDDADEVDDVDDVDDHARAHGDVHTRRRHTGRKRADHPVPEIEAAMRRQGALKYAYRAICRSLKPVLAEISLKTVEELQANPTKHEEVAEYQGTSDELGVQKQLDEALEKRKQQIEAQRKWGHQLLRDSHAAETAVREAKWRLEVEQLRDLIFDQLEHDMLIIAREAQLSGDHAPYETDNEDGDVVLKPKRMGYQFVRTEALDSKYDSRSRLALEAERAIDDLHARQEMTKMLQEFNEKESQEVEQVRGFTVMDPRARNAAIARSMSIRNTNTLASAAAQVEYDANKPIIPNAEAFGLQKLSDEASRRTPLPGFDLASAFVSAKPDMHMPPPLPPAPTAPVRRNVALEITHLLQKDMFTNQHGIQQGQQPTNLPGLALSSPRRSSFPDPVFREHALLSPFSNVGGGPTFPSPSSVPAAYHVPQQPHDTAPQLHHSRTVSLGTSSRSDSSRFATNGTDASSWERPSSGMNDEASNASVHQQQSYRMIPQEPPLSIKRINPNESSPPADRFNDDSPSNSLLSRPIKQSLQSHLEASGNTEPGATDSRSHPPASPRGLSRKANSGTPANPPRSRESSMKSQSSNRENTPDAGSAAESAQHQKGQQMGMSKFPTKLNKDQRGGHSRKEQKRMNRLSQGSPVVENNKPVVMKYGLNSVNPTPDNKGTMSRWRLNKTVTADTPPQQTSSWNNSLPPGTSQPGQHIAHYPQQQNVYNPPPPRQQPVPVPPPLAGFATPYYLDPHHGHRSSFPGAGPQQWQQAPPSPSMYNPLVVPQPPGYQPPPGHWQQQHHLQQQQQYGQLNPARGPHGTMQPVAHPITQQYGGPAIAPATGSQDPRSLASNAGSNAHPPAFAQRTGQDANKSRGRAQSDVPPAKYIPYVHKPKPSR